MTAAERIMATFLMYFCKNFLIKKEYYPTTHTRSQTLLKDSFILQQILHYLLNCLISQG